MNKRGIALLLGLVFLVIVLPGCSPHPGKTVNTSARSGVEVYTSIYPIYDFTKKIGGNRIQVTCLVPPGADPHNWEPSPRLLARLQEADLFLYNGAGMEPWLDKLASALGGSELKTVEVTQGMKLLPAGEESPEAELHEDTGEPHEHGAYDPHVWLDPVRAGEMARTIEQALAQVDPGNRQFYAANYARLARELDKLDTSYRTGLARCSERDIVVTHRAFAYLAQRYGLRQVALMGISAEAEPTPAQLAEVSAFCQEHGVKFIFFEKLRSPRLAQIIAREVGARVLVLDPIGGLTKEQLEAGDDYFSIMYTNLGNLKKALGYQP